MESCKGAGIVLLACMIGACGGSESRWAGTVTDSAGVTIVSNTDVGIWEPGDEWTVEEEVRIGALDGPAEYQIGQVGSIAIDSRGRILVLDNQAQQIRVYSPDGVYEETIGARGGGPGELGYGMALLIGLGDTLLVPDFQNLRFSRYAPDGSSTGSIRLDPEGAFPMAFKAAASGTIVEQIRQFALPGQPAIENPMDLLVRLASDGSVTDTFMTFPAGKSQRFDGNVHLFATEPVWDVTGYSEIILGMSDEYRIGVYPDGQLERIIAKTVEPVAITDQDIATIFDELERRWTAMNMPADVQRRARERFHFAEYVPPVLALAVGPAGTIWVQHMRSPSEFSEEELASVRVDHPEDLGAAEWDAPSLFRDDKIYGVWRDELNVEYVLRLRIVGDLGIGAT